MCYSFVNPLWRLPRYLSPSGWWYFLCLRYVCVGFICYMSTEMWVYMHFYYRESGFYMVYVMCM
jgi:hypothetical protein